jgi:hypothetical protein
MKHLLSVLIFSFLVFCSSAQTVGERITMPSVVIYNNSNTKKSILLGETPLKMDTFKIKKNEVWFSPVYQNDPTIKIQTQSHITTYQLKLGNYYMIYWNGNKKYWDIKKTVKR